MTTITDHFLEEEEEKARKSQNLLCTVSESSNLVIWNKGKPETLESLCMKKHQSIMDTEIGVGFKIDLILAGKE